MELKMANEFVQTMSDARVDARSLSDFVFKPAGFKVPRRLAPPIDTLQFYIDRFDAAKATNDAYIATIPSIVNDAINNAVISSGFVTIDSFELGATITQRNQALRHAADGRLYRWAGDLPKVVPVGSAPTSSGGIAANAWLEVSDTALRQEITSGNLVTDALTTIVPITTSATARTQLDKNRENVSILDFFTDAELTAYRADKTTFDAYRPVQSFFSYIDANDVGTAKANGYFYVSKGIAYNSGASKTLHIVGDLTLEVLDNAAIHTLFHYAPNQATKWDGTIRVNGNRDGTNLHSARTCEVGIRIGYKPLVGTKIGMAHTTIGAIVTGRAFKQVGVWADDGLSLSNLGEVLTYRCGSGAPGHDYYSLWANFSNKQDNAVNSTAQYSWIDVDTLPPDNLITKLMISIDGDTIYAVEDVDRVGGRIKIFPMLSAGVLTGRLKYIFGAGVYLTGNDSSVCQFSKISDNGSAITLWIGSLYAPVVDKMHSEHSGIALILGNTTSSALIGGQISGFYTESVDFNIVKMTRSQINFTIVSVSPFNLNLIRAMGAIRNTSTDKLSTHNSFDGVTLLGKVPSLSTNTQSSSSWGASGVTEYRSNDRSIQLEREHGIYRALTNASSTFNLPYVQEQFIELFNQKVVKATIYQDPSASGGSTSRVPQGSVSFKAPADYTVNGEATVMFSGFDFIPEFLIVVDTVSKNFDVRISNNALTVIP